MNRKIDRRLISLIVFIISAVLFIGLTMPFRTSEAIASATDMRPNAAITPVLGLIFGFPAVFGCAVGNLICDIISHYEISYAVNNVILQIIFGMLPLFLWRKLNNEGKDSRPRLDSVLKVYKFCLIMLIDSLLIFVGTGILNHAYSVTNFISMNNLYIFLNSFDSSLLFGCPLMIAGNFLQQYMENLRSGSKKKVFVFSLNERVILNTIITGVCICFLVDASIYLSETSTAGGSSLSVPERLYLFETLALNIYFFISLGFAWFSERKIAQPIEELAEVAKNYYAAHSTEEQRNEMIAACEKYAGDSTEAGNLARSYISMVKDLTSYVENLKAVTAEKERINAELSLASDIQAHMLPCIFPAFPDRSEFDVYATMTPAKEVGGDFYDFFMVDNDHLAVVMADVSGKGVPAALFMVIAKTLIKNHAQIGLSAGDIFTSVNKLLCEGNDAGLFVTAWLGILDLSSGKLTYVNAGHNPPLLCKNGKFDYLRSRPGFVLAGMETVKYRQNEIMLEPGGRLFLYTDGVTEATNADNELYGEERLSGFINANSSDAPENVLHELKKDIDSFVGDAPQFDDITMLMLDFKKRMEAEK